MVIMHIKHLNHSKIDFEKWDKCIAESINSLTYACSWYLDIVSPDWEALISENYEYIMPLPVKKKIGFKYIVQPILTQQLGIFSVKQIDEKVVESFISSIPYFSFEINLNEWNFTKKSIDRVNLILELNFTKEKIERNFSKNTLRNIAKAKSNNLLIDWELTSNSFLDFYFSTFTRYYKPQKDITLNLIRTGERNQSIIMIGARDTNLDLVAALCLLKSNKRLIFLLPISNENGKEQAAMFFLISAIIDKFSSKDLVLDFEGSVIEGIARFYKGFGAELRSYYLVKRFRPNLLKGKL